MPHATDCVGHSVQFNSTALPNSTGYKHLQTRIEGTQQGGDQDVLLTQVAACVVFAVDAPGKVYFEAL